MTETTKILLVVSEDWIFQWHCLPIARAARDAGFDVVVATGVTAHGDAIRNEGFRLRQLKVQRGSLSPLGDLRTIWSLWRLYRQERPSLVHNVAMKPVLYGGIAARLAGARHVVSWVMGLGFVPASPSVKARLLRPLLLGGLRLVLRGRASVVLVQNPDDRAVIARLGVAPDRIAMVRGNGVDLERFAPTQEPAGPVRVSLVARLIREKGIDEFVAAARTIRRQRGRRRVHTGGRSGRRQPVGGAGRTVARLAGRGRRRVARVHGRRAFGLGRFARGGAPLVLWRRGYRSR